MTRIRKRVAAFDWPRIRTDLDRDGFARIADVLTPTECRQLAALYRREERFRNTISLERYRFGKGEYRYFSYPLPPFVSALRQAFYSPLARIANGWSERLRSPGRFPSTLAAFSAQCCENGQSRPTPLLLHYEKGGYNCLHQDLYGSVAFPLQLTCLLSRPEIDFSGGEFMLVEQRPRRQSRGEAIALRYGEAIVFATRDRPVDGVRGVYRARLRHGVSRVRDGERTTLGVIFHDAR